MTQCSFDHLLNLRNIPQQENYRYVQLKHFYISCYAQTLTTPATLYEQICSNSPRGEGLTSDLYRSFVSSLFPDPLPYMRKWEEGYDSFFFRIGRTCYVTYANALNH